MTMADDENKNIDLCIEVEKLPCLYDVSLDGHSNRQLLEKAWTEIGAKLDLSGEVCRKRWANLRTVFVRRRSKNTKSGSGFKKEYYLNKYMQFRIPHTKLPVQSIGSNLGRIVREHSRDTDKGSTPENEQSSSQATNKDADVVVESDSQNESFSENVSQESLGDNINHYETFIKNRRQKKITPASKVDEAFIDYFHVKKQKLSVDPENARKCFLLSLLPEVNALPEVQFKVFKRRSLALLDELDMSRPTTSTSSASQYQWDIRSKISSPSNIALLDIPSEINLPMTEQLFIPPQEGTQQIEKTSLT